MSEAQYIVVDVKSAIARFGLGTMSSRPAAESQIEYLAWFRFPVTWTYISGPVLESSSEVAFKPLPASQSLTLAPIVPAPLSRTRRPKYRGERQRRRSKQRPGKNFGFNLGCRAA